MLVLTRRIGETLFINDAIEVTVVKVEGNQVRLGIDEEQRGQIYFPAVSHAYDDC